MEFAPINAGRTTRPATQSTAPAGRRSAMNSQTTFDMRRSRRALISGHRRACARAARAAWRRNREPARQCLARTWGSLARPLARVLAHPDFARPNIEPSQHWRLFRRHRLWGAFNAALSGVPSGAFTLDIEVVSGTCQPQGVNLTSAAAGVRVHKLGSSGSQAAHWAAVNATGFQTQIAALGLDGVQILLGTNDTANDRTPTQFSGDIATIAARVLAAVPSIDRLVTMPPENQRGEDVRMADCAAKVSDLCITERMAFLNLQPAFGDASNPSEYGSDGTLPLFLSDHTHPVYLPDPNGAKIVREILGFLGVAV